MTIAVGPVIPSAPIVELTAREKAAAVLDLEAWADWIESKKGLQNPRFTFRVEDSLRKVDVIVAILAS